MLDLLLGYIEYLTSDTWFKYAEKAEELYRTDYVHYIPKVRQIFLLDLLETFIASLFISFICSSVVTLVYRKKYNTKIPENIMFKVLLHSFFIAFFKTEFILLSPVIVCILCFNYLLSQEIKTAILKTEKKCNIFVCFTFHVFNFLCNGLFKKHIIKRWNDERVVYTNFKLYRK